MAIKCQQCGAFHTTDELVKGELCPTCDGPYAIKNYKTVAAMPSPLVNKYISTIQTQLAENPGDKRLNGALGICFLKLNYMTKPCHSLKKQWRITLPILTLIFMLLSVF